MRRCYAELVYAQAAALMPWATVVLTKPHHPTLPLWGYEVLVNDTPISLAQWGDIQWHLKAPHQTHDYDSM